MKNKLILFHLIQWLGLVSGGAQAASISLEPSQPKVHHGENVFFDINISGLQPGTTLGGWALDFNYNSELFHPYLFAPSGYGDRLGNLSGEAISFPLPDTSVAGVITIGELSLLSDTDLAGLQSASPCDPNNPVDYCFSLATLGLNYYGSASSGSYTYFSTSNIVLSDGFGDPLTVDQHLPASVQISEPSVLSLFGIGACLALGIFGKGNNKLSRS